MPSLCPGSEREGLRLKLESRDIIPQTSRIKQSCKLIGPEHFGITYKRQFRRNVLFCRESSTISTFILHQFQPNPMKKIFTKLHSWGHFPNFWSFGERRFFQKKSGSVYCLSEKTNESITRKPPGRRKDGSRTERWRDGRTDRPKFIGPFLLQQGGPKNSRRKL